MTYASQAVQNSAIAEATSLTSNRVKAGVSGDLPHWRIETVTEDESGRNKDGSASSVTVLASFFSRDLTELYDEMGSMGNSLPQAISPVGFRVLGVQSRVRQIVGSEEPDKVVYGRQLEIELIVEPTA